MRTANIKGKEITISEEEFRKIKNRFNIKNFKPGEKGSYYDDMMINENRCCMCDNYYTCRACPFYVLTKHNIGCFEAVKSILTPYQRNVFLDKIFLFDDVVGYYPRNKKAVEKIIKKIYSAINEGFRQVKKGKRK